MKNGQRIRFRILVLAMIAGSIVGCASNARNDLDPPGHEQGGQAKEYHPQSFEASIGGFLGASYRVALQEDGALLYLHNPHTFTSSPGTEKVRIEVTEEQWRKFRNSLDAARVWGWKKDYSDPGVQDGTQWNLKIGYTDASVTSHGNNAFPPKESYERFCRAVATLLGGRPFR